MAEDSFVELIQDEFDEYGQQIEPADKAYRFPTERQDDGHEHLEIFGDKYHLVATERGEELSRRSTGSKDELIYWLVSNLVWKLALDFELANRIEGQDFRRIFFAKQVEILDTVNSNWAATKQDELNEVLEKFPFSDNS